MRRTPRRSSLRLVWLRPLAGGGGLGALPPAAAEYSLAYVAADDWDACSAMEGLLAPRSLLAPITLGDLFGGSSSQRHHTYAGALAVCAAFLAIAAVLGAMAASLSHCCCGARRSDAVDADAPQQTGGPRRGAVLAACAAVRFPATLIETFLFLANGAAVAAGMALGGGGGPRAKANGGGDGSTAAAARRGAVRRLRCRRSVGAAEVTAARSGRCAEGRLC